MAKLDLDIVLIDDSVVDYGFRAKMSGADLENFKANPVLLFQHNRPSSYANNTDIVMPIGRWNDIRVDGNRLLAKPEFDDDDELAVKVQGKVKKGYLNAASVWIDPIEISEDANEMLPGQSLPTFTRWSILEASIVDIPNCKNALAIRNAKGKRIQLSGDMTDTDINDVLNKFSKNKNSIMDKKFLCALLGLPEDATEDKIKSRIGEIKLAAEAQAQSNTEIKTLKDQIIALKTAADKQRNEPLIDGAIVAKKILAGEKEDYLKLAVADYDTTAALIGKMQPQASIQEQLSKHAKVNDAEVQELMKLSGRDLYMNGKLERLKEIANPEQFQLKYKEAFGIEFKTAQA